MFGSICLVVICFVFYIWVVVDIGCTSVWMFYVYGVFMGVGCVLGTVVFVWVMLITLACCLRLLLCCVVCRLFVVSLR